MFMPAIDSRLWTANDVRALPDEPGKRYECVDGMLLVSPSPRLVHQSAVLLLGALLNDFAKRQACGAVFTAPGDMELDQHTLVQPDVYVLPLVEGRRPTTPEQIGHALLFVEVLSPGTARDDRVIKRERYQRYGVQYWIVDLDARLVERWMPDAERPEIITGNIAWQPSGAATELTIDLDALFAEALGER